MKLTVKCWTNVFNAVAKISLPEEYEGDRVSVGHNVRFDRFNDGDEMYIAETSVGIYVYDTYGNELFVLSLSEQVYEEPVGMAGNGFTLKDCFCSNEMSDQLKGKIVKMLRMLRTYNQTNRS